jgi:acetyl esterase
MLRQRLAYLRKDLGSLALDRGLRGLAQLAALHPSARPERHGVRVVRNVAYGHAPHQRLDVYEPAQGHGTPVLYLHGGGFRILSKDTHWAMALGFARHGYTVFVPDYRLAPRHPFPEGLEDAAEALLWLTSAAATWRCDRRRLVLAGESAGGNFVTALAIARSWERREPFAQRIFDADVAVAAVLPACPLLQLSQPGHRGTPAGWMYDRIAAITEAYLPAGVDAAEDPVTRQLADVICFLEAAPSPARPLPPLFGICGDADPIVRDTERLIPAWRHLGGEAGLRLYPGAGHAFHAFFWTPSAKAAWRDQHDFLRRTLVLP